MYSPGYYHSLGAWEKSVLYNSKRRKEQIKEEYGPRRRAPLVRRSRVASVPSSVPSSIPTSYCPPNLIQNYEYSTCIRPASVQTSSTAPPYCTYNKGELGTQTKRCLTVPSFCCDLVNGNNLAATSQVQSCTLPPCLYNCSNDPKLSNVCQACIGAKHCAGCYYANCTHEANENPTPPIVGSIPWRSPLSCINDQQTPCVCEAKIAGDGISVISACNGCNMCCDSVDSTSFTSWKRSRALGEDISCNACITEMCGTGSRECITNKDCGPGYICDPSSMQGGGSSQCIPNPKSVPYNTNPQSVSYDTNLAQNIAIGFPAPLKNKYQRL